MKYIDEIKKVISEAAKVNFAGHSFILKVDVNEDPQKKGIKVQFLPTQFGAISPTEQNDISIELEERLEKGLAEFGMRVDRTSSSIRTESKCSSCSRRAPGR